MTLSCHVIIDKKILNLDPLTVRHGLLITYQHKRRIWLIIITKFYWSHLSKGSLIIQHRAHYLINNSIISSFHVWLFHFSVSSHASRVSIVVWTYFHHILRLPACWIWVSNKIFFVHIRVISHLKFGFTCMLASGGFPAKVARQKPGCIVCYIETTCWNSFPCMKIAFLFEIRKSCI